MKLHNRLTIIHFIGPALLITSAITTAACAHRFEKAELVPTNRLSTEKSSPSNDLAIVMKHIEEDFRKLPTQHHDELETAEELELWISAIARLNPTELSEVRAAFASKSIASPFIKNHWKLFVRDENFWRAYHSSALIAGTTTLGIMSFLVPICPTLETALANELLREVGKKYSKLSKNRDLEKKKLSPRRYADASIRCLVRPAEWIQNSLTSGKPILEAYDSYRMHQKKLVFSEQNVYGTYTAEDVTRVSLALQKWLISSRKEELENGGSLILLGSFPNFKAHLQKSDLDLQCRGLSNLTAQETKQIQAFLEREGLGTLALPVNADNFVNDWYYSRLNPISISISLSDIRLRAYPTQPYTTREPPLLVNESLINSHSN